MRYTRLRVWAIFLAVVIGVIAVLNYSTKGPGIYKSSSPITDSLLTAAYPDLYEAILKRDAQKIKPFLSHKSDEVREQAWRALANTPVDSLSQFITLAKQSNSAVAWFGISMKDFTFKMLRELEQSWLDNPHYRSGIARVLGRQGDKGSLDFLLNQLDSNEVNTDEDYHFGLAIGRLVNKFDIEEGKQIRIIQNAFDTEDYRLTQAYLYGWYRGDESRLTADARDTLLSSWRLMGTGISRDVDQYVNKILPSRTTYRMVIYYNGEQMLDHEVQLSYELATSIGKVKLDDKNILAAKILLTNSNPHVQVRVLQSLQGKINSGDDLYTYISETMIPDASLGDAVWLQAVKTIGAEELDLVSEYHERLENIPGSNRYLWPQVLGVFRQFEPAGQYLSRVAGIVGKGDPLSTMFALQDLQEFWKELSPDEQRDEHLEQVRSIVFQALEWHDRGVAYMAQPLLREEPLFTAGDFSRINKSLSAFSLPGDIEVYQVFGSLYKNRFEEQAKAVVDSLAALNYAPLNRSLAAAGWEVSVPEVTQTEFRKPNWSRLWELGKEPVLTFRTEKGSLSMQLNPLTAPATVSAIDSLSRTGAYDEIPFHRVVPNFVIQGGDIERKDGFGGPEFVIPTEASDKEFVRGAVGIASAGTDTEGSQYFIMHQWMPHLNGNYTRFGKIVDGMNVVDNIQEGDKVLSTSWY